MKDFTGDAVDFLMGLLWGLEGWVEVKEEVFPLAYGGDAVILHTVERIGYGLSLRIEDGAFEGDVDVCFHGFDYTCGSEPAGQVRVAEKFETDETRCLNLCRIIWSCQLDRRARKSSMW